MSNTYKMLSEFGLQLEPCKLDWMEDIARLEAESFPPDEMASKETVHARITEAGKFFQVVFDKSSSEKPELLGFINGTCVKEPLIYEESMSTHYKEGRYLVIHSVTIAKKHRRRGIGLAMLSEYMKKI